MSHAERRPLHASLLAPTRTTSAGVLPFALLSTLHERPASGASRLSGLDGGSLRRALHAMGQRDRPSSASSLLFAAEPPRRTARQPAPALVPSQAEAAGGARAADEVYTGVAMAPSGAHYLSACSGVHTAPVRSQQQRISPRSLALHTPRGVREARRRWRLVRANLWRLVNDERERLGLMAPEGGGASTALWSIATDNWEGRSAEEALRKFEALRPISELELHALQAHTSLVTVPRYSQIYRKGLPITNCFLIQQGAIRLSGNKGDGGSGGGGSGGGAVGDSTRRLEAGTFVGGGAWLPSALHPDTATALTPCVLLVIRAAEAKQDPRLRELSARLAVALGDPWKIELLSNYVPFFSDLPLRSLRELVPLFKTALVEPGTKLITQGEVGEHVYVLVQGEVRVYRSARTGKHGTVELTHITDQSELTYFGEVALYHRQLRTANVQAVDRCFLLVLEAANFDTFMTVVPDFSRRVKMLKAVHDAKMAAAVGGAVSPELWGALGLEEQEEEAPAPTPGVDRLVISSSPVYRRPSPELTASSSLGDLGLTSWIDSLAAAAPMPSTTTLPRRKTVEPPVIVNIASDVGFIGIRGREAAAQTAGPKGHGTLLREAAVAAEAARQAILDPTKGKPLQAQVS